MARKNLSVRVGEVLGNNISCNVCACIYVDAFFFYLYM